MVLAMLRTFANRDMTRSNHAGRRGCNRLDPSLHDQKLCVKYEADSLLCVLTPQA
jgi:hypothetical protein